MPSPLDLVELPFMRTALAELALLAVAGGLVGAWIVLRRQAFFAHAAGTATFPGLVAADASGVTPTLAGIAVALGYAGGVERAGRGPREHGEATALLLVTAVYVLPAAAARLLTRSVRGLVACALALALTEGVVGLYLAYWLDVP